MSYSEETTFDFKALSTPLLTPPWLRQNKMQELMNTRIHLTTCHLQRCDRCRLIGGRSCLCSRHHELSTSKALLLFDQNKMKTHHIVRYLSRFVFLTESTFIFLLSTLMFNKSACCRNTLMKFPRVWIKPYKFCAI